jgi:hypothetical protein
VKDLLIPDIFFFPVVELEGLRIAILCGWVVIGVLFFAEVTLELVVVLIFGEVELDLLAGCLLVVQLLCGSQHWSL